MKPTDRHTPQPLLPLETFQPAFRRNALVSAVISSAIATGVMGVAQAQNASGQQQATQEENVPTLAPVEVIGHVPYQATEASSLRITAPLRDTPRTITVIPEQLIRDRGATSLADVLRTTPGITLGAGEGGTPMGDRPFIRGYEASTDLTVDGVRDFARGFHETFNLEAVEIVKGPSSAYGGRGGTGGSLNMQSKTPKNHDFVGLNVGAGNADQWSTTLDGNLVLHERVAARLNVMKMGGKTPGRDFVTTDRFGIAPSVTFGMGLPTRATLSYSLVKNEDMPDVGMPFSNSFGVNRPPKVDRSNFYGRRHVDFRESHAKLSTLLLEHDFDNGFQVRNITRHSDTLNHNLFTRPSFSASQDPRDPNAQYTKGVRLNWRSSKSLINQTDLTGTLEIGSFKHHFNLGMEFGKSKLYDKAAAYTGLSGTETDFLHNPDSGKYYALTRTYGAKREQGNIKTASIYLFDTVEINEQFQINAGLRYEDYKATDYNYNITATNPEPVYKRDDKLFNYQLGVVYKPASNGSVYLSYATSSNPAGENLGQGGGADGAAGATGLTNKRAGLKPEKTRSIELGTKWDVLQERLSLTAAIFETKKTDARSVDPLSGDVTLDGQNRTRGVELGVSGAITRQWDVWAGYTYLDPKNVSYRNGTAPGANFSGNRLKFIPKQSASLWTTYKVLPKFSVGGGATFMGMRYADDANNYELPSYIRYDAMAKYDINKNFALQLNVNNISDTELYDASHVGAFYSVGPGRSYMLTASYRYE